MLAVVHVPSPFGAFALAGDARGLTRVWLPTEDPPPPSGAPAAALRAAGDQVADYLAGRRRRFAVRLGEVPGTPFQRAVWEAIAAIPYGEVATYGEIAARLGRPGAARAVGQATGANPRPLIVPCHRVVACGGLGGYGGGIALKEFLLDHEARTVGAGRSGRAVGRARARGPRAPSAAG